MDPRADSPEAKTRTGSSHRNSLSRQDSMDDKSGTKRPREQYSCVECFRRKQKCDRRFPCNNCIKRRLPERCVPPSSARASGNSPASSETPSMSASSHIKSLSELLPETTPVKRQRVDRDDTWDDRRIDAFARTTSRVARLERILSLHDPNYLEQRLALAEKAIQSRGGEDRGSGSVPEYSQHGQRSRRASFVGDDPETDRHGDGHLDDNDGFLGTSALETVPPQLQIGLPNTVKLATGGNSPQPLLSYISPNPTRRGFPIPSADVQSIRATLPNRMQCDRYFDAYFSHYNWARSPIHEAPMRDRYRHFLSGVPSPSDISIDTETLPFVALILALLTLGSVPPIVQPLSSATSHAFFWATKKALVLCETLGLASLDSCWAHAALVRYLDVIRVTRASWHEIGSWIRDALDLGLHRDGSSFGLPKEQVAARRILWSHVIHNDREWSIILGRPLTITFFTTEMPTREDLEPLGFACQTYLLARNRFTACLEAITHCFEERSQLRGQAGRANRTYYRVTEVDDQIAEFVDSLPPYLAPNWTSKEAKTDTSLDQDHPLLPFYRYLIWGEICFYRSLLHRPYLLRPASNGKHPYPKSRRVCVEMALNDLRSRKEYAQKLSTEQLAQSFGGAYALFNSAIVVGMSLLIGFNLGEHIDAVDLNERLGYLQDFIAQLRRNFDAGNVDASAEREQMVIEVLVSRLEPYLPRELARRSRGEVAAAQGSMRATRMQDPYRRGPTISNREEQERQQAIDSLRLLSSSQPGTPTMSSQTGMPSLSDRSTMAVAHAMPSATQLASSSPIGNAFAFDSQGAVSNTLAGGAGGNASGGANPIDPYGWLLTPTGIDSPKSMSSVNSSVNFVNSGKNTHSGGTQEMTSNTPVRHGRGISYTGTDISAPSPSQLTSLAFGGSADAQAPFDWEGILQTIGSGWTGDGTLETGMENIFG